MPLIDQTFGINGKKIAPQNLRGYFLKQRSYVFINQQLAPS